MRKLIVLVEAFALAADIVMGLGTYVVPFLCRCSGGAWHSVDTSSPIEATVVGWRVR